MKNLLLFILVFLNLQLISCQRNTNPEAIKDGLVSKSVTESFFNQFTTIYGDNGLLQTGNADLKKGNYEIYLISNKGAQRWFNELNNKKGSYEIEIKKLNTMDPKKIAENFDIWVFYTDKNFLLQLEDESLGIKVPGIIELYYLKSGTNQWKKKDSYNIKNEDDKIKSSDWKQIKLEKILKESNDKNIINSNKPTKISETWMGKYSVYFSYGKIGEQNTGWALDIEITKEKITAVGEGYQIGFKDLLTATERSNDELLLNHAQNLSGYSLGSKMSPEFILTKSNNRYFIKSEWIDSDVITKPESKGYLVDKVE